MIFLSVGTQLGFDRLVRAVDSWSASNRTVQVTAQIGAGSYIPKHLRYLRACSPEEFESFARRSQLLIAHAGIGSLLTAINTRRPLIVFPRSAELGEHRNNHQHEGVERFFSDFNVHIARDQKSLHELLDSRNRLGAAEARRSNDIDDLHSTLLELRTGVDQKRGRPSSVLLGRAVR